MYSYCQRNNLFILRPCAESQNISLDQKLSFSQHTSLGYLFISISQDNIKSFTDVHVGALWEHMANYEFVLEDTLYSLIIPITLEYINVFTRNNATALGSIATSALKLNVQSDELWNAILNKLNNEDIYRYLTLAQTVLLLHCLAVNGRFIKHPLIAKL